MLVTEIRKLDDKRYCLYLDYEPYCSVYSSDIRRLKLAVGENIDDEVIFTFRKDYLFKRAFNKAVTSLKYSEKSEYDIRLKLKEYLYDDEIIGASIAKLKSYGYIDDYRYACSYIRKFISKKGRGMIMRELSSKEISEDIIEKAFQSQEFPDEKSAINAILMRRFEHADIVEKREKIMSYLIRKGFTFRMITDCMKEFYEQ